MKSGRSEQGNPSFVFSAAGGKKRMTGAALVVGIGFQERSPRKSRPDALVGELGGLTELFFAVSDVFTAQNGRS